MTRLTRAAFLVAALTLPALAAAEESRTLTVQGEGRIAVAPDMAWVSIGVTKDAAEAGAALDAMSAALEAILARLSSSGIAETDIQTGQLSLDLRYSYPPNGEPRLDGYVASSMLQVRVRDLDILGKVLSAATADGANQLGGIRFDVADRESALNAAREAAVADAVARAGLYARAAGVTLGDLMGLSEGGGSYTPQPLMDARLAMEAAPVPVAAGELEIAATVILTYAIE